MSMWNLIGKNGPATEIIEEDFLGGNAAREIADRLRELDALREQRLVTENEYERKRAEILNRL